MRLGCAVVSLLLALLAAGCGGSDSSGGQQSFVGSTTTVVLYVTWTRDGDQLTGSLTQGVRDASADGVTTKRVSVTGTVVGDGVSLDLKDPYGDASRLTGKLQDGALDLEYLNGPAGVTTVHMEKADGSDFNSALAKLRDAADETRAEETAQAAESTERDRVGALVQTVIDDIAALKTAFGASLPGKAPSDKTGVERLRRELRVVRENARKTAAADGLSVCSSAALVKTGADQIASDVQTLRSNQERAAAGTGDVNEALQKLLDDYADLGAEDDKNVPSDAPTRSTVNRAIRSARRKLRKLGKSDDGAVRAVAAILEEAQGLATRADIACQTGGG